MTYEDSVAERSGFAKADIIELHDAHCNLIKKVLSPLTNERTDAYGGSLEKRYWFAKEIIEQIRGSFKGSLWIRLSLTAYDDSEKQNSLDDWKTIGKWLEKDGIDCIDVSTGGLLDKKPNIPVRGC